MMIRELELVEAGNGALTGSSIDRAAGIIRGTVMITAQSANGKSGRTYTEAALRKIAAMAEGIPAFANHVADKAKAFEARDVRELIGRHKNVRYDAANKRVVSDLFVAEHMRPLVFSLADTLDGIIGNSLVSRGLVRVDDKGKEIVEDVVAVRSADLVTDPATTRGLFEHREHRQEDSMSTTQKARQAISQHELGRRFGSIKECVSETFVSTLIEAGEARWPALLDTRLTMLDGASAPAPRVTATITQEGSITMLDNPHARLAATINGVRYLGAADMRPSPRELAEAADREQRRQQVRVPEGAHQDLFEALGGEAVPAGAHERMARALRGAR